MDIKINIGATANPAPVFPKKSKTASKSNDTSSQVEEAVALGGKKKGEVSVGFADKKGVTSKEAAEIQEVMRKALGDALPQRELRISLEKDLHRIVFKVHDKGSGELIRQIPLPEQLSISRHMQAWMDKMAYDQSGIAVDQEV